MQSMSLELFHEIYYMLKQKYLEPRQVLLKENDETDIIYIVESGQL
jgi:hypothetical protein